jgi:hypothetical protein
MRLADQVVFTRGDRGHVSGNPRRGREVPDRGRLVGRRGRDHRLWCGGGLVGQHGPVRGRGHLEGEFRLQVRLFEVREHAAGVGGLEVCVQVHLPVGRVDRPVQARPAAGVAAVGNHPQFVAGRQAGQCDPPVAADGPRIEIRPVQRDLAHGLRDQVGIRRRARLGTAEPDDARRAEHLPAAGQFQGHVIGINAEQSRALGGLGQSDLRWRHR